MGKAGNKGNYHPRSKEWKKMHSASLHKFYADKGPNYRKEMGKRVMEARGLSGIPRQGHRLNLFVEAGLWKRLEAHRNKIETEKGVEVNYSYIVRTALLAYLERKETSGG